jgi:hypothetical protein
MNKPQRLSNGGGAHFIFTLEGGGRDAKWSFYHVIKKGSLDIFKWFIQGGFLKYKNGIAFGSCGSRRGR